MPMSLPPWKEVSAMRDYEWKSSLSAHMKAFIETNRLAGLKFERQECFLQHFDHFCFYNGYEDGVLTKEMAESFIYGYGGAAATLRSKENLMYGFADFMRKRGYHAYLPERRTKCPKSQHIPHIYTEDERRRFWLPLTLILIHRNLSGMMWIPSFSVSFAGQAADSLRP